MKELHKNPILYFILIPAIGLVWPLLAATVYLPQAKTNLDKEKRQFEKMQVVMSDLLELDPTRLDYALKNGSSEFDYANAIEKTARKCNISPRKYKLSSSPTTKSKNQKSQNAMLSLEDVTLTEFATFISTIQFRWPSLQCVKVKLQQKKGLKDKWDVDLNLRYYY